MLVISLWSQASCILREAWNFGNVPPFLDLGLARAIATGVDFRADIANVPGRLRAIAVRNDLSVREAVNETLGTIKIQVNMILHRAPSKINYELLFSSCTSFGLP